jgi:hypothetical protein
MTTPTLPAGAELSDKEPWETPAVWAKTLFHADGVSGRIDMTLEEWLGFGLDPERLVWSWHDSYDESLEVCIKGVDAEWHMPDVRVDEILSWGFSRVWFHYEDGTEQTGKGKRHKPSINRYREDSQSAKLARMTKRAMIAEAALAAVQ